MHAPLPLQSPSPLAQEVPPSRGLTSHRPLVGLQPVDASHTGGAGQRQGVHSTAAPVEYSPPEQVIGQGVAAPGASEKQPACTGSHVAPFK